MDTKEIKKLKDDKLKAKQKQNFKEVILLCNYLGDLYSNNLEYHKAIEQHKEELEYGRKLNDNLSIAVAYRRIGECYSELSEFENAINFQNHYKRIVEKLKDTVEIQRAYATLGRTYFMQYSSDPNKYFNSLKIAEEEHLKALNLTDCLKNELKERDWAEMRCRALLNLGLIYDQRDDEEKCSSHFGRAITLARNYGFKEDLHRCEISLAAFYFKIKNYEKSLKMFNTAILSAKQLKNKLDLFDTLIGKANTLIHLRDFDGAKRTFKKAYFIYKNDCNENYEAKRCFNLIKQILIKIDELNCELNDEKRIKIYDKLGDLFADLNCYSIALEYYNKELNLAIDEKFDSAKLAPIYLSLGQTYLDNKEYEQSIYYFRKEIECNKGKPKEELVTSLKIIEVKCCLKNDDEDEIINDYEKILNNLEINNKNDNKLKIMTYKEYLNYAKEINNQDLIKKIKFKLNKEELNLQSILNDDSNSQQSNTQKDDEIDVILSDVSELESDSDLEENEELTEQRRSRRAKKGLDEKRNEKGETPLHRACIEGNLEQVEKLIEKGHKINPRDNCGWLPIHEASNHGFSEIVDLLIKNKAWINDPGGKGCDGTTPIHDACTNGHLSVIRLLLRAGANVTCVDYYNNTPLDCLEDYYRRSVDSLTAYEKKDIQLLFDELKSVMERKGYNFNQKKSLKRSFSSIDDKLSLEEDNNDLLEELSNKIDRNKNRFNDLNSPPRKTNRLCNNKSIESLSNSNLRKNLDHNINQLTTINNKTIKTKPPRIESLIDEANLLDNDDDWLEDDLGIMGKGGLKSKPINDPFENNKTRTAKNKYSPPIKSKKTTSSSSTKNRLEEEENENSIDCFDINDDYSELNNDIIIDENSTSSDIAPLNRKIKRKQTKINNYFDSDTELSKKRSTNDDKRDDIILLNSQSSLISNQSNKSNLTTSTTTTIKQNKLKVHVHIDSMILLVPLPNENTSIGWLMKETIERYYSFKKIRPIIQLKTMDGALLSNDDQIIDVLSNMEVKVEIDSFQIKPINELYSELCELEGIKIINELDYEFRISMASGCLNLRNCFLDNQHFKLLLNSFKMQTKIKVLDLSYSNLIKLDDNFNLIKIVVLNLTNLEILNLECTALNKQHLIELTKYNTKLVSLNLNYNLLMNCVDLICDILEKNLNLIKLFLQFTDLTEELITNLRLNQLIEKRSNLQLHIDNLKNSKIFINPSFVSSCLDILEVNEFNYIEFNKKLFI